MEDKWKAVLLIKPRKGTSPNRSFTNTTADPVSKAKTRFVIRVIPTISDLSKATVLTPSTPNIDLDCMLKAFSLFA